MTITIISLCLLCTLEWLHIIGHCNVLFPYYSKPRSTEWFYENGWYFVLDMCTALCSFIMLCCYSTIQTRIVFILVLVHFVEHMYYILYWNKRATHVVQVVEWSSAKPEQRSKQDKNMFHIIGTAYDIATHAVLATLIMYHVLIVEQQIVPFASVLLVVAYFVRLLV